MRHYTGAAFDVAVNFQHIGNFFFRIDVDMEKRAAFCRIITGNGCPAAAFLAACQRQNTFVFHVAGKLQVVCAKSRVPNRPMFKVPS